MAIRICAVDGVNRTYVSSCHCDSSYFPIVFKHMSAESVKVKNNIVPHCNLNHKSQYHLLLFTLF